MGIVVLAGEKPSDLYVNASASLLVQGHIAPFQWVHASVILHTQKEPWSLFVHESIHEHTSQADVESIIEFSNSFIAHSQSEPWTTNVENGVALHTTTGIDLDQFWALSVDNPYHDFLQPTIEFQYIFILNNTYHSHVSSYPGYFKPEAGYIEHGVSPIDFLQDVPADTEASADILSPSLTASFGLSVNGTLELATLNSVVEVSIIVDSSVVLPVITSDIRIEQQVRVSSEMSLPAITIDSTTFISILASGTVTLPELQMISEVNQNVDIVFTEALPELQVHSTIKMPSTEVLLKFDHGGPNWETFQ